MIMISIVSEPTDLILTFCDFLYLATPLITSVTDGGAASEIPLPPSLGPGAPCSTPAPSVGSCRGRGPRVLPSRSEAPHALRPSPPRAKVSPGLPLGCRRWTSRQSSPASS